MFKSIPTLAAASIFGLAPPVFAGAPNVGVLVEFIEVEQTTATRLIREHAGKADALELRDAVQKLVDGDKEKTKAHIASTTYVRTTDQQRAKVQSVIEFIYPTEYDPPEMPSTLTGPIEKGVVISVPASPTAFAMRPVGITLEVEPTISKNRGTIELKIAPQSVEFVGDRSYGKDESEATQPLFFSLLTTTSINIKPGAYALLAVHAPRTKGDVKTRLDLDPDRSVLVFIRATTPFLPPVSEDE